MLQFVHQVLAGQTQEIHFQKFVRQVIAALQDFTEGIEFFPCRQVAEKEKKTGFLIEKTVIIFPFDESTHIDTTIVQDAVTIYFMAFGVAFIADDIGNPGQTD